VFGLLGSNGAGKTTIIRMTLGIIKKDEGSITWKGKDVVRENVNFGYLPEERGIYPKVKIYNQLMYFAKLRGMKNKEADTAIRYWLKKLELEEYISMTAEKLSKGNQQKVQFVTAVMHDPELIVLDEPFSGLDPINAEILKDIVLELVEKGKYIILSSHQMNIIEEFCKDLIILDKGKTILQGNLNEIKNGYQSNKIEVITKENIKTIIEKAGLQIQKERDNNYEIAIKNENEGRNLYRLLGENDVSVVKFELKKPSLNDIFIEKVGESR
jgi:ABC-2 type transport system ATP-binding protein